MLAGGARCLNGQPQNMLLLLLLLLLLLWNTGGGHDRLSARGGAGRQGGRLHV
jgi:hypothetical protein